MVTWLILYRRVFLNKVLVNLYISILKAIVKLYYYKIPLMKKLILFLVIVTFFIGNALSQTRQASHSQSLKTGVTTVDLINGLKIKVDFSPEKGALWFTGESKNLKMFITEFIPLADPLDIGIEIGKSYRLDNMYVSIEYKVLTIENNRVTRIWFRIAATLLELPQQNMI